MESRNVESQSWARSLTGNFSGPVWITRLSEPEEPGQVTVLGVHFPPGSRTHWHSHPEGQVLHVVAGRGVVSDEKGQRLVIKEGDTITAPPNTLHWHGALDDSPMTHLSITTGEGAQWPGREVTEDEYLESNGANTGDG